MFKRISILFFLINSELKRVAKSKVYWAYLVMILLATANGFSFFFQNKYMVINTINILRFRELFDILLFILVVFISTDIIWHENEIKNTVIFSYPLSNEHFLFTKLITVLIIFFIADLLFLLCGISFQTATHSNININLYLSHLFFTSFLKIFFISIIIFLINIITGKKYLSLILSFIMLIFYSGFLDYLGINNLLVRFNYFPPLQYSDFFFYGQSLLHFIYFSIYWLSISIIIILIIIPIWPRYHNLSVKHKIVLITNNFIKYKYTYIIFILIVSSLILFYWDYSNIGTSKRNQKSKVIYEKKYSKFKSYAQPVITSVKLKIDVYTSKRELKINGSYCLVNNSQDTINTLIITIPNASLNHPDNLSFNKKYIKKINDSLLGFYVYKIENLFPKDSIQTNFELTFNDRSFFKNKISKLINENAVNMTSLDFAPVIGYKNDYEIKSKSIRKKYFLPENSLQSDNLLCNNSNIISQNSSYINFNCLISTDSNQLAISSGELIEHYNKDNRSYFRYIAPYKIINYYGIFVGKYNRYQFTSDNDRFYNIYSLPENDYSYDTILKLTHAIVRFYNENLIRLPFKSINIIEVPSTDNSYASCIQNTIKIRENTAFFNDQKKIYLTEDEIFTLAHEISHFWFGMLINPCLKNHNKLLTESLAQFYALKYIEKNFGIIQNLNRRKILLNGYLQKHSIYENPISSAKQNFIFYRKAPLFLYSIEYLIGEYQFSKCLNNFLKTYEHKLPYPTSENFITMLRKKIPDSLKYLVDDWYEKVTLYDLSIVKASAHVNNRDKYIVNLRISGKKLYLNNQNYDEVNFSDYIQIAFKFEDKSLTKWFKIKNGDNYITTFFDKKPKKCIIDPNILVIDNNRKDNTIEIK